MLEYLKHNNKRYKDIIIEPNNIPENLLGAYEQSRREENILTKILEDLDHPIEVMLHSEGERADDSNLETTENCLDAFRITSNKTSLISNKPNITAEEVASIAPGESHKPVPVLTDKLWQELSHPHLFPTG